MVSRRACLQTDIARYVHVWYTWCTRATHGRRLPASPLLDTTPIPWDVALECTSAIAPVPLHHAARRAAKDYARRK